MATTRQQKSTGSDSTTSSTENMMKDVKDSASEALGQAKDKVSEAAGQAQQKAKSQLAERKDVVADGIDSVAAALRHTGEELEGQDTGPVGKYVSKAANALSDISNHVRQNDVDQLLHEVEGFARREPAIALGSAFAIGILAARFLKSSSQRRYNAGGQYDSAGNQYASSGNQYSSAGNQYASGNYPNSNRYSNGQMGSNTGTSSTGASSTGALNYSTDYSSGGMGTSGTGAADMGTSDMTEDS